MNFRSSKCFNGKLYLTIEEFPYYMFSGSKGENILVKSLIRIPFTNKEIVLRKENITGLTDHGKFVAMCVFGHEVKFKDLTLYTKVGELNALNHKVIFDEKMDFKATNTRGVIFSNKTSKYYGYTHRGICGFGIGDMLFDIRNENDYLYYKDYKLRIRFVFDLIKNIRNVIMFKSYIEDGIKIITPFNKRGSKKIETLEEAKKAAINFMKYLS